MLKFRKSDVIFVIVALGILAAIAIPVFNANDNKVIAYEAEDMLSHVYTELRIYNAMYDCYPIRDEFVNITSLDELDLSDSDFSGNFYNISNIYYKNVAGNDFILKIAARGLPTFYMTSSGIFTDAILSSE